MSVQPTAPAPGAERRPGLDGLRAVAAFAVIGYHVSERFGLARSGALAPLLGELKVGVTLFFILSGFVLYLPHARALTLGSVPPDPRRFLRRRLVRIVPAYWVALAGLGLVLPAAVPAVFVPRYLAFAQIYDPQTIYNGLHGAWSLDVELSFYLVLPLLGCLLRRLAERAGRDRALPAQLAALAALAIGSWIIRLLVCGSVGGTVSAGAPAVALTALPGALDWFALGMALAVVAASDGAFSSACHRLARRPAVCFVTAGVLLAGLVAIEPRDLFLPFYTPADQALAGVACLLTVLPAALTPGPRLLRSRPAVWLGTISYAIYLWHATVLWVLTGRPVAPPQNPAGPGTVLPALAAVALGAVGIAALSWYLVERPLMRRFGGAGTAAAVEAAAIAPGDGAPSSPAASTTTGPRLNFPALPADHSA